MAKRFSPEVSLNKGRVEVDMEIDDDGEFVHESDFQKVLNALIMVHNDLPAGTMKNFCRQVIRDASQSE